MVPGKRKNATHRSAAQQHRLFQHRIEHGRKVAGRGIDDLQHFGGRGLLLKRLPLFHQQPRVFDRYDCLVGKCTHKVDLPVSERSALMSGCDI